MVQISTALACFGLTSGKHNFGSYVVCTPDVFFHVCFWFFLHSLSPFQPFFRSALLNRAGNKFLYLCVDIMTMISFFLHKKLTFATACPSSASDLWCFSDQTEFDCELQNNMQFDETIFGNIYHESEYNV